MGDGGAVFCKNKNDYEQLQMLRNYGQKDRYNASLAMGINSRLDEFQAAILCVKLNYLDKWNRAKSLLADQYRRALLLQNHKLILQHIDQNAKPAWHLMVVKLNEQRDEFISALADKGIQVLIHYPIPAHHQKAFQVFNKHPLPITEAHCRQVVSLPLGHYLTSEEIEMICEAIKQS